MSFQFILVNAVKCYCFIIEKSMFTFVRNYHPVWLYHINLSLSMSTEKLAGISIGIMLNL